MASNKKRVSIGLTDAQYALVQKFAKERRIRKKGIRAKKISKNPSLSGRNFCLRVLLIKAIIAND